VGRSLGAKIVQKPCRRARGRERGLPSWGMAHILLVDDDGHIREIVHFALKQAGHRVTEAKDGALAWQAFQNDAFDLAILDIVMPEMDGLELCRNIRRVSTLPVLFLSSRDEELDRVLGLELGADDYITKPFSPRELVARVKAALRRYQEILELKQAAAGRESAEGERLRHGAVEIDVRRHRCTVRGVELTLTVTEFDLLRTLVAQPGRVFSREQLVEQAYGVGHHVSERTVDSHLRRVRQKLQAVGEDPIETVYGLGYRLKDGQT
jgi:two-component system, OmpR family, response regulator